MSRESRMHRVVFTALVRACLTAFALFAAVSMSRAQSLPPGYPATATIQDSAGQSFAVDVNTGRFSYHTIGSDGTVVGTAIVFFAGDFSQSGESFPNNGTVFHCHSALDSRGSNLDAWIDMCEQTGFALLGLVRSNGDGVGYRVSRSAPLNQCGALGPPPPPGSPRFSCIAQGGDVIRFTDAFGPGTGGFVFSRLGKQVTAGELDVRVDQPDLLVMDRHGADQSASVVVIDGVDGEAVIHRHATLFARVVGTVTDCSTADAAPANYIGNWDLGNNCDKLVGWAANLNLLNASITVSVYDNGTLIGSAPANQSRPDVAAFIGDGGFHGFTFATPASLKDGAIHLISIRFASSLVDLGSSPRKVICK